MMSWLIALCDSVEVFRAINSMTQIGIALSCFALGSSLEYALNCQANVHAKRPSISSVGLGLLFSLKVATT